MIDTNFWVLGGISVIFLVMGLLVAARNPHSIINRTFLYFALAIIGWIWTNIVFLLVGDSLAFPVALASYFAAALIGVYVLRFALTLTRHMPSWRLLLSGWVFSLATLLPGFLATGVKDHAIQTTPFLNLYAVFLLGHFIATTVVLFRYRKKSTGYERQRTNTVLVGLGLSFVGGSFFNLILPLVLGNYSFVQLGPVMSTPLVVAMVLAIARQRLFDIRFALARSAAYVLALFTVFLIYGAAVFAVIQLFFGGETSLDAGRTLVYLIAAVFLAFTYEPIKRFFGGVTDKIFFQHGYDTQSVLNKLGDVIVNEIDLRRLSQKSLKILADALKPEFTSVFVLSKSETAKNGYYDFHSSSKGERMAEDIKHDLLPIVAKDDAVTVAIRDELDEIQRKLSEALDKAGAAVVAKLQTSTDVVGYLVIGPKQNGSIFNTRDLRLLETAIDELAVATQNSLRFYEIMHFNETLKQEIKEATAQLRQSNQKLRKLDEAKDEFISMASHQLRTPLTGVKGYISMALEGDAGKLNDQQKKLLEEAFMSAQRMVYLIGDFLNVSRIQTGKFVLELRPINLAVLVQEEINQLVTTASRRNIKLEYHMPQHFPAMQLDEDKMRQVVMNFTDNAIYYSKPDSTVKIELLVTGPQVQLKVKDTGIGVPEAERKHLFTKFYRAENARKVRPDGTGVGLFMAKKVVDAHGGSIIFESQLGRGSTFGFSMPIKTHPPPAVPSTYHPRVELKDQSK